MEAAQHDPGATTAELVISTPILLFLTFSYPSPRTGHERYDYGVMTVHLGFAYKHNIGNEDWEIEVMAAVPRTQHHSTTAQHRACHY